MNLLAHALLSDDDPGCLIGNVIADFVRVPDLEAVDPSVKHGIVLHRRIDTVTDAHPVVKRAIQRLRPRWGRYGAILVDVFYDHVLALDFEFHSGGQPLSEFTTHVYAKMLAHRHLAPAGGADILDRMAANDLLGSYARIDAIAAALARIERRMKRPPPLPMARGVEDLAEQLGELKTDFEIFFPELRQTVTS